MNTPVAGGQLRVGLWGLGTHARRNLLPAFDKAASISLIAVHTRDPRALEEAAASTGARVCRRESELLDAEDVDVIYVATPTGLHFAASMAVLEAGKHVWCEKAITGDIHSTVQLMAAATAKGRVALETDMFLHHPQFRTLESLLKSGTLGEIRSVTARFGFPHRDPTDFRYSKTMGGGALLDAGFYPLAAAVAILGTDLKLRGAVMAADASFEVDTGGSAILGTEDTAAFIDWGFGRAYRSEIEVWCQDATVIANRAFAKPADLETELRIRRQSGGLEVIPIPAADHFAQMLDDFAVVTAESRDHGVESILARSRLSSAIAAVGVTAVGD